MKKRMVAMAMSVLLMMSACMPGAAASAETGSGFVIDEDRSIQSVAVVKAQIYILDGNGTITTRTAALREEALVGVVNQYNDPNQPQEQQAEEIIISELIALDDKLYGVNVDDGRMFELVNEEGSFAPVRQDLVLDVSAFTYLRGTNMSLLEIKSLFAQDGWLYYAGIQYVQNKEYAAGRISLETGEHQEITVKALRELAPYKDGKVLALIYEENAVDHGILLKESENLAEIAVLDPQSGSLDHSIMLQTDGLRGGLYTSNICYADGQVYYLDSARVKGLDLSRGNIRISAYTGDSEYSLSNLRSCYADGWYLTYDYSGLTVRKLDDESIKDGVLTVYTVQGYGDFDGEVHKSFSKNYPEIPVDRINSAAEDFDALTQALMSESQMLDVLQLQLTFQPLDKLAQKGYCLDLSGYPEITSRIETMYPQLRDAMLIDGKLYGVPVNLDAFGYGVNMPLWEALGLTGDDLPTSVIELLDFVANWMPDYGDEYPDVDLFYPQGMKDALFSSLVSDYALYMQNAGQPLLFDTPEFRQIVDAYEQINFNEFSKRAHNDSIVNYNLNNTLFTNNASVASFNLYPLEDGSELSFDPMPLSILGDDKPLISAYLTIMIINPRTKRLDQALKYMTNFLDNLDARSNHITMFTDHNDPVDINNYQRLYDLYLKDVTDAQERLASTSEENKPWVQADLDSYKDRLAILEENRYDVTPEQIATYRESVTPYLCPWRDYKLHVWRNSSSADFYQIISQYTDDIITADQLIKELDVRLRMMALEE